VDHTVRTADEPEVEAAYTRPERTEQRAGRTVLESVMEEGHRVLEEPAMEGARIAQAVAVGAMRLG
jgi:hypothetical protein